MSMSSSSYQPYRSQFGDTTFTKLFVGGLAWETHTDEMQRYFEQFGEILEAVIIADKNTGRSKGYGFVTFRDPDSARRACMDPNPMIDGRMANCNIASFGRPRQSPPRGRTQTAIIYNPAAMPYNRVAATPPPPPPVIYPSYGYTAYTPNYGYPQTLYNPHVQQQYYPQLYGTSASTVGSPYYYGYSLQTSSGTYSVPQAHGIRGPTYLHYTAQGEGSFTTFSQPAGPAPTWRPVQLTTDSQAPRQISSNGVEVNSSESEET